MRRCFPSRYGRWCLRLLCILLPGLLIVPGAASAQHKKEPSGEFRAGAATSNITPPIGLPIVGGFDPQPSTHVHDELHARCLVLDDGQTRLAIVVADNVGIPREVFDAAKKMIEETTGIPADHVMMSATHTHSAASVRSDNRLRAAETLNEYQQFVATRMADGVRRAVHNLRPARIGWGSASVPEEVFNRRWHMSPGTEDLRNPFGGEDQVRMNPPRASTALIRPAGPVDPEVSFISVQTREGQPLALLANYSLHYVGGVSGRDISADYFAVFADRIQQLLGADRLDPPFVGIMSNGTSGDVNNIDFRNKASSLPPYEKIRQVAERVAQAVHQAHGEVEFHDWVPLAAAQRELTLATRKPTDEQSAWARRILAQDEKAARWHRNERAYAQRVLTQEESPDEVSIVLQAFRIGDLRIAAIPFEVFAETGLELKKRSALRTFTISLANGSYGYLPTPPQHELGGYETWLGTSLVEIEASTKIVDVLLELLDSLHTRSRPGSSE